LREEVRDLLDVVGRGMNGERKEGGVEGCIRGYKWLSRDSDGFRKKRGAMEDEDTRIPGMK
jgi:hypothetical protein